MIDIVTAGENILKRKDGWLCTCLGAGGGGGGGGGMWTPAKLVLEIMNICGYYWECKGVWWLMEKAGFVIVLFYCTCTL